MRFLLSVISSCDCICLVLSFVSRIHLSIVLVNFLVDMTVSLRRRFRFGPQFGGVVPYDVEVTVAGVGGSGSHCRGSREAEGSEHFPFSLSFSSRPDPMILRHSLLW